MQARKKTLAALRRHVQDSERRLLEAQMEKAGLQGEVRVAAEVPLPPQPEKIDNEVGPHLRRQIPSGYTGYDPKALKPLAEVLWAMSVALGHAMTAHRKFTKLKSSTISPDGLLGGRGYVMSVKDIRTALHDACEAISAVSDTIHDEINAPHWKPKLSEMELSDKDNVERLVGESEKNLENPESDIEDDLYHVEVSGEPADLDDETLTPDEFGQEVEDPSVEDGEAPVSDEDEGVEQPGEESDESNPFGVTDESDEDNPFADEDEAALDPDADPTVDPNAVDPTADPDAEESDEDNPFAEDDAEGDVDPEAVDPDSADADTEESDESNPFAEGSEDEEDPFAEDEEDPESDATEAGPVETEEDPFADDEDEAAPVAEDSEAAPEEDEADPFADEDESADESSAEETSDDELVDPEEEDSEPDPFADEEETDESTEEPAEETAPEADPFADSDEPDAEAEPEDTSEEDVVDDSEGEEEPFQDTGFEEAEEPSSPVETEETETEEPVEETDESQDETEEPVEEDGNDPFSKALDAYLAQEAQGDEDEEEPVADEEDEDGEEEFRSALPDGEDAADNFPSRQASRSANSSVPTQTLPGPRVQHLDRGDSDQTGPFGSYNSEEPHSDYDQWSADDGVSDDPSYTPDPVRTASKWKIASSAVPDSNSDPTPTEGYDFGIGYGDGNDAHGQGAGGYANPTSDGKGVYGPSSQMPHDPGGKLHDDESDTTPSIEFAVGRGKSARDWKANSKLPNDVFPRSVARSDYYQGVKDSNMFDTVRGQSELPDFARNDYESETDSHPGLGYRLEQGTEPYVKWDSDTKNMRTDDINQRDDKGPYVREG